MPLWPVLLLWASLTGLGVVAVSLAVLSRPEDDFDDSHRRAMRALGRGRR